MDFSQTTNGKAVAVTIHLNASEGSETHTLLLRMRRHPEGSTVQFVPEDWPDVTRAWAPTPRWHWLVFVLFLVLVGYGFLIAEDADNLAFAGVIVGFYGVLLQQALGVYISTEQGRLVERPGPFLRLMESPMGRKLLGPAHLVARVLILGGVVLQLLSLAPQLNP